MNWDIYWDKLINDNNLNAKISELNDADIENGFDENHTKNICKKIYEDFTSKQKAFSNVKHSFFALIEDLNNVHSFSSRLKEVDSLIVKIINKRYDKYPTIYKDINEINYSNILGDIIGMRIILHYQGQWKDIHNEIINLFPETDSYPKKGLIAHRDGEQFMAEEPKAYYADGDDCSQYEGILKAEPHSKGYRSIHYVISYQGVYIELQMRTIYDEAWSDCDHNYVYKNDANPNNLALKGLTSILSKITNCASDIAEMMHLIYYGKHMSCRDNKMVIDAAGDKKLEKIFNDLSESKEKFGNFYEGLEK